MHKTVRNENFQRQGNTEVESKTVWDTVQGHYPQNIMIVFAEVTPWQAAYSVPSKTHVTKRLCFQTCHHYGYGSVRLQPELNGRDGSHVKKTTPPLGNCCLWGSFYPQRSILKSTHKMNSCCIKWTRIPRWVWLGYFKLWPIYLKKNKD